MKQLLFIVLGMVFILGACTIQDTKVETKQLTQEEALKLIDESEDKKSISKDVWLASGMDEDTYDILWEADTERAFTGELNHEKREGTYVSAGCEIPVFSSEHKYDSGSGWPSFTHALNESNIVLKEDNKFGLKRVEVLSKCGEHLGHVFDDGPAEKGGKRFCINSKALKFIPKEEN